MGCCDFLWLLFDDRTEVVATSRGVEAKILDFLLGRSVVFVSSSTEATEEDADESSSLDDMMLTPLESNWLLFVATLGWQQVDVH